MPPFSQKEKKKKDHKRHFNLTIAHYTFPIKCKDHKRHFNFDILV